MTTATATATAPDTRARALSTCTECGQPIRTAFTAPGHRAVQLSPEAEPGGLYALDTDGRARRHPVAALYAADRAGAPLDGYAIHECEPALSWWAE